jgi:hypothetical protein
MLHVRTRRSVGYIPPCLPSRAERPPSGPEWLHEIKHDGFRIMARRNGNGVQLYTRNVVLACLLFPKSGHCPAAVRCWLSARLGHREPKSDG